MGKSKKQSTADDLEPILKQMQDETATSSPSQWLSFALVSVLSPLSIAYLYSSPILALPGADVSKVQLGVSVLLSAVFLMIAYNDVATRTRNKLFSTREVNTRIKGIVKAEAENTLKSSNQAESSGYAMFSCNATYMCCGLILTFYMLPMYGYSITTSSSISTILPALAVLMVARANVFI
eukprot:CAMPEP_0185017368 /NCGR_PEP_ID=MMETSP1103-20130426/334_1 /TAXON_ID=36769 /ORGANISM="Paraphysomonas bandaiensis, Strain Caron Lab Isolate" /LENGTH=179 /DNA_ID=CAMNT_0027546747 /DNA_START=55 /DNA_END=594 /DNA_ORIENTATION=-